MPTLRVDIGSPDDVELFAASLDGQPYTHKGASYLVEYEGGTLDGWGRGERVYRLVDPAVYDWGHGSNETFVP